MRPTVNNTNWKQSTLVHRQVCPIPGRTCFFVRADCTPAL
ncbi:hypothetical protein HMPREF1992_00334 [Selenomonas sp. oral taxon 892 str. F0426]|nr:hypothetical protein HMPREF1992_00334 [Selenomonas sp. oral taxon 892 str. F0426]